MKALAECPAKNAIFFTCSQLKKPLLRLCKRRKFRGFFLSDFAILLCCLGAHGLPGEPVRGHLQRTQVQEADRPHAAGTE